MLESGPQQPVQLPMTPRAGFGRWPQQCSGLPRKCLPCHRMPRWLPSGECQGGACLPVRLPACLIARKSSPGSLLGHGDTTGWSASIRWWCLLDAHAKQPLESGSIVLGVLLPRPPDNPEHMCRIPASLGVKLGQRLLARSLRSALVAPEQQPRLPERVEGNARRQPAMIPPPVLPVAGSNGTTPKVCLPCSSPACRPS